MIRLSARMVITDTPCRVDALGIQPDGRIVVAGHSHEDFFTNIDFIVVRYNADGSLDTDFDTDGIVNHWYWRGRCGRWPQYPV